MEQKKINLTLLLSVILFAVGVAVKNISTYFMGYGIVFVGIIGLSAFIFMIGFRNKENRKRLYDIFTFVVISIVFGLILYCSWEWAFTKSNTLIDFQNVLSNVYSIFSLIFLVYGIIRYVAEISNVKLTFVEVILGFKKIEHKQRVKTEKVIKPKQPKEVEKGDLEQKPIAVDNKSHINDEENAEQGNETKNNQEHAVDNSSVSE